MKIIFVHLGREHLGIEYLSSVLKENGHQTSLACDPGLFCSEDNVFYIPFLEKIFSKKKKVIADIKKADPDLVIFSVYTSTYQWACEIARTVKKEMDVKTAFGGIHVTLLPEKVLKNDFVDFIVIGEGEYAILDLVKFISSGETECSLPGVWCKKDGEIIKNDPRPPIVDLDVLPLPDKELFEKYVDYRDDYITMTSRGCIFDCSYCCESFLNDMYSGRYFRRRSVSSVIKELAVMKKKYGLKRIMFFDSVLFTDREWLEDFLKRYKQEINIPFRCTGHVKFVNESIINAMKDAGCYGIDFGVQTFNEYIRKNLLNRAETNEEIDKAFSVCDNARLRYDVDLILGLPLMKEADYALPVKFMRRHKYFNRLKCYNIAYYPKLEMIKKARELGAISEQDVERYENGDIGDWFHIDKIDDPAHKRMKANFEKLYKLYPVIPKFMVQGIMDKKLYRAFYIVPGIVVAFLQLIAGIFKNDPRFSIYINNYVRHIKKKIAGICRKDNKI